jgi:hypothetical protein
MTSGVRIAVLLMTASLCACESQAEKDTRFVKNCTQSGFSAAQCGFLNAMANKSADDASMALVIGVAGMGVAASKK